MQQLALTSKRLIRTRAPTPGRTNAGNKWKPSKGSQNDDVYR